MSNYNPKSLKAEEFISHEEILKQLNMPKRTNIMLN